MSRQNMQDRDVVVTDATPLHIGGASVVLNAFIEGIRQQPSSRTFIFFCHPRFRTPVSGKNVRFIRMPEKAAALHKVFRMILYLFGFNLFCLMYRVTGSRVLFVSLASLPALMAGMQRQNVLVHQPHVTRAGREWRKRYGAEMPFRRKFELAFMTWLLKILNKIERIQYIVQTEFMAAELHELLGEAALVDVIRPGMILPIVKSEADASAAFYSLLCLTRGYPHKHLEDLLPLCNLIKSKKLPVKILTTLGYEPYELHISSLLSPFEEIWTNLGILEHGEAMHRLGQSTALLWTSRLESLGLPLVECMALGRPVVSFYETPLISELLGEFGLLLEPDKLSVHSVMDACRKAREISASASLRESLRVRARSLSSSPEAYVEKFMQVACRRAN